MTASTRSLVHGRMRIVILAGLIALVLAEWLLMRPDSGAEPGSGLTASIDAAQPIARPNVAPNSGAYDAVVTSDLFSEKREAPPAALARLASAAPARGTGEMHVVAIVTSGAERVALVQRGVGSEPLRVRVGDVIAGSKVRAILPSQIVLIENGRERTLGIEHQEAGQAGIVDGATLRRVGTSPAILPIGPDGRFNQEAGKAAYDDYMRTRQIGVSTTDPVASESGR